MIAVDTSSLIAYLEGSKGTDVEILDSALENNQVALPPIALTEILSDSTLPKNIVSVLKSLPILEVSPGYWERAGKTRSMVLNKSHKARLADTLIAQSCLDHKMPLLTRDNDFKAFSKICGLILVQ